MKNTYLGARLDIFFDKKTYNMKFYVIILLFFISLEIQAQGSWIIFINDCDYDYLKIELRDVESEVDFEYIVEPNSKKQINLIPKHNYIYDLYKIDECGNIIDANELTDYSEQRNWDDIDDDPSPTLYRKNGKTYLYATPMHMLRVAHSGCTEEIKP